MMSISKLKLKCRNRASAEETSEIQDLQTNACDMTLNLMKLKVNVKLGNQSVKVKVKLFCL